MKRKVIYVFGDSHTTYFGGSMHIYDKFQKIDVGYDMTLHVMKLGGTGATMFGLGNTGSISQSSTTIKKAFEENEIKNAVFVVGEIDCREHIRKNLTTEDVIENINVTLDRLDTFLGELPLNDVKLSFYGVNPPSSKLIKKRTKSGSENFVSLNFTVAKFNQMLSEYCEEKKYNFFSTYRLCVNDFGFLEEDILLTDGLFNHVDPGYINLHILRKLRQIYGH